MKNLVLKDLVLASKAAVQLNVSLPVATVCRTKIIVSQFFHKDCGFHFCLNVDLRSSDHRRQCSLA